jgi:hypothetical protein
VADFQGSGIEFYTSLTVPSLTAQSFSTSGLNVGDVTVGRDYISVGDVHVYNQELSYSELEG